MAIVRLLIDLFVAIFFIGVVGSTIVVALSFVEDLQELFGE
jgi:hypothetical protein